MKKILLFLCLLGGASLPAWSCSVRVPEFGYEVRGHVVVYQNGTPEKVATVAGADAATFSFDKKKITDYYAVDANHVYYKGAVLEGANPKHIQYLGGGYDHSNNQNDGYLKDDRFVYYLGQRIEGADALSFGSMPAYEAIKSNTSPADYFIDKHHVYLKGQVIAGDPATARTLPYQYYLDAKHIYVKGKVLDGALPDAFELKSIYLLSNGHVFKNTKHLPLEAKSFEEVKEVYGLMYTSCDAPPYFGSILKDSRRVYILSFSGEINALKGIDAGTLRFVSDGVVVDKNHVYTYSTVNEPLQLTPLQLAPKKTYIEQVKTDDSAAAFYKDNHQIYFMGHEPQNLTKTIKADASTFAVFTKIDRALLFVDKHRFYTFKFGEFRPLEDLSPQKAKLVCLQEDMACFLMGNTLYYVYETSSERIKNVNASELKCFANDISPPNALEYKIYPGQCFDRTRIYDFNDGQALPSGAYEQLLPYAVSQKHVQQLLKKSLETVTVTREPLLNKGNTQ